MHYSRIEGAYRFADFAFGVRASSNITFWLERELVRGEFAYLAGNLFDVMWGTLALSPMKNFAIGAGFHRDGELTEWGKPLPYQSPEDWPDKWDGGVNYFIFVGYSLEL
ncbi:MAG TPA: hypothetical protein ENN07_03360 [candidate division Zixibacteria bacterium]|nr:hypothetical protein [candidate division Zixibacteria bacterium]